MARLLCGTVRGRSSVCQARMGRGMVWGAAVRVVCMSFSLLTVQVVAPTAAANGSSLGQVVQ